MEPNRSKRVRGSSLKSGDVIRVWWQPNRDTITSLEQYNGPLKSLWPEGARIARFAQLKTGMTIGNDEVCDKLN
jgi:hypothetical protein